MTFDYARIRATADRLLTRFQQGEITLTRRTETPGENRWDDPVVTTQTEALRGVVQGVAAQFVDGTTVLATDLEVMCAPPAMGLQAGDRVSIDGKPVTIVRQEPIPAAGIPAAFRIIVR